jgi:subtilisin family serine protease
MGPLDLTRLMPLMERTAGNREIVVGLVDGPVDMGNSQLTTESIREVVTQPAKRMGGCSYPKSISCRHGTFVAGILAAKRGSKALAICPKCTFLVRPIFTEEENPDSMPSTTPDDLAAAITAVVEAGANVVNLSCQLLPGSLGATRSLDQALDYAAAHGAICVAAAGNDGFLGSSALTHHRWVIPVASCDGTGRPAEGTNLGHSVGRRGLLAPGEGIHSLGPGDEGFSLGGTSAAAPFVTGAAALLWSEFPEAGAADIWQALTQGGIGRRNSVVPPLLNAWGAYQSLCSRFGRAVA